MQCKHNCVKVANGSTYRVSDRADSDPSDNICNLHATTGGLERGYTRAQYTMT